MCEDTEYIADPFEEATDDEGEEVVCAFLGGLEAVEGCGEDEEDDEDDRGGDGGCVSGGFC